MATGEGMQGLDRDGQRGEIETIAIVTIIKIKLKKIDLPPHPPKKDQNNLATLTSKIKIFVNQNERETPKLCTS